MIRRAERRTARTPREISEARTTPRGNAYGYPAIFELKAPWDVDVVWTDQDLSLFRNLTYTLNTKTFTDWVNAHISQCESERPDTGMFSGYLGRVKVSLDLNETIYYDDCGNYFVWLEKKLRVINFTGNGSITTEAKRVRFVKSNLRLRDYGNLNPERKRHWGSFDFPSDNDQKLRLEPTFIHEKQDRYRPISYKGKLCLESRGEILVIYNPETYYEMDEETLDKMVGKVGPSCFRNIISYLSPCVSKSSYLLTNVYKNGVDDFGARVCHRPSPQEILSRADYNGSHELARQAIEVDEMKTMIHIKELDTETTNLSLGLEECANDVQKHFGYNNKILNNILTKNMLPKSCHDTSRVMGEEINRGTLCKMFYMMCVIRTALGYNSCGKITKYPSFKDKAMDIVRKDTERSENFLKCHHGNMEKKAKMFLEGVIENARTSQERGVYTSLIDMMKDIKTEGLSKKERKKKVKDGIKKFRSNRSRMKANLNPKHYNGPEDCYDKSNRFVLSRKDIKLDVTEADDDFDLTVNAYDYKQYNLDQAAIFQDAAGLNQYEKLVLESYKTGEYYDLAKMKNPDNVYKIEFIPKEKPTPIHIWEDDSDNPIEIYKNIVDANHSIYVNTYIRSKGMWYRAGRMFTRRAIRLTWRCLGSKKRLEDHQKTLRWKILRRGMKEVINRYRGEMSGRMMYDMPKEVERIKRKWSDKRMRLKSLAESCVTYIKGLSYVPEQLFHDSDY